MDVAMKMVVGPHEWFSLLTVISQFSFFSLKSIFNLAIKILISDFLTPYHNLHSLIIIQLFPLCPSSLFWICLCLLPWLVSGFIFQQGSRPLRNMIIMYYVLACLYLVAKCAEAARIGT